MAAGTESLSTMIIDDRWSIGKIEFTYINIDEVTITNLSLLFRRRESHGHRRRQLMHYSGSYHGCR